MISQFSSMPNSPYLAVAGAPRSRSRYGLKNEPIEYNEVPSLLWNDAYNDDHEELYRKIQHISDYMLQGGPSVYSHANPNTARCRPAYRGEIDMKDYDMADAFYGMPGSAAIKDYAFFHSVTQRHIGGALNEPLKFSYRDISPAATTRYMKAVAAQLNESHRRAIAEAMQAAAEQSGQPADFSFLTDPDIVVPQDSVFIPPTQSLEERAGHALLVDTVKRHKVKDVFRKCREDAIQINARMAHIVVDRKGTRPVRLDPDRVHWIAPGPIRTDADCDAIGTWDYPSVTEILNQDGNLFPDSGTIRGLTKTVEDMKAGSPLWYNPRQYWLAGEHQSVQPGDRDSPMMLAAMWQDKFYPGSDVFGHLNGQSVGVLRHQIYFKMIRFMRCRVLINGKAATDDKLLEWQKRNYDGKLDIRYVPMEEDEKKKAGEYIDKIPIVNMWQARRYGHNTLVDVHRCTHVPQFPSPKVDVRFPIIIHVSFKRGFVALGLEFQRMWNTLWNRIDEQLNLGGAESALLIDEVQIKNKQQAKSMMWQAKKTAVLHYNSSLLQDRSNGAAQKHLTRVQLTNESNTINNMLSLAGLVKSIYEGMVGDPGQAGKYDSAQKLGIVNNQQANITTEFGYEDNLFQNDVFQRTAEVQKTVLQGDQWAEVSFDGASSGRVAANKKGRQAIFIPKTLADVEPMIEVDNGMDLMNIRQKIEGMAEKVLPSGGASGIREFIRLLFEDDPYEALAIFDAGMNEVEKAEAANAKSAQENAKAKNDIEAQKMQIPIQTMTLRTEADKLIAHVKDARKAEELNAKGDMKDIEESNQRERMMLENELQTGQSHFLQDADTQNQAQLQGMDAQQQAGLQQQDAQHQAGLQANDAQNQAMLQQQMAQMQQQGGEE